MSALSVKEQAGEPSEADITLDRLASIGQIAAGIAHEVKNPLTAVKGFLQLLKEKVSHHYLDIACEELENALSTLQNLLHVSKPDLEDEPYVTISLSSELESILYLFQDRSYHHVTVNKHFSDTNEKIYGKRNQLKKALFNLLKNAFEAIRTEGSITIEHYVLGGELLLRISDTGEGIPPEKLSLLGTPFYSSKSEGTGMGLTQVFSTVYAHRGVISVKSELGIGTAFTIKFPAQTNKQIEVVLLNLNHKDNQTFEQFFEDNRDKFTELLIAKGKDVIETVKRSSDLEIDYILQSARTVAQLLTERNEHALILHAKEHGANWAKFELGLITKLEWIQMLRTLYWDFLYTYYSKVGLDPSRFFHLERSVNYNLDTYLMHFSSSFSEYKNKLLQSQQEVIKDLTVPVISISDDIAILPIVGTLDTFRAKRIQEDVLVKIYDMKIKRLIIDLSGVAYMDTSIITHLFKIVNGISIQGCRAVITGIRPEITNTMVELGISLNEKVETMGTLQQAIETYQMKKAR